MQALRWATYQALGDHYGDLFNQDWDGMVDQLLLRYVRSVAQHGVPARDTGRIRKRFKTRPHTSAKDHLDEIMESIWKDAAKGRVLLCSDPQDEHLQGVVSSP